MTFLIIVYTCVSDSETTDPISLDDTDDEENSGQSAPSTPMEELVPKPANRVQLFYILHFALLGPVVQNIVTLTRLLRGQLMKCLTTL